MPKITAIVTNYNKEPWLLTRCIDSIKKYDLDYIIVDDCSDDTEHLSKYENKILLDENVGTFEASLVGIEYAKTEYILRVDADDYIVGKPIIADGFDAIIHRSNKIIKRTSKNFLSMPYAALGGSVLKRQFAIDVWYTDMREAGDIVIFNRILNSKNIVFINKDIYFYDRRHSHISNNPDRNEIVAQAKEIAYKENMENI